MTEKTSPATGRLARAVLQVYQHESAMLPAVRAKLNGVLHAARCMDFAERLRSHPEHLVDGMLAGTYAELIGIGPFDLRTTVLPTLKAAGVLDFTMSASGAEILRVEEFVALSAPFLVQVQKVLDECHPSEIEITALESIQLGTLAPLAARDHRHRLSLGHSDAIVDTAVRLSVASGVLHKVASAAIGEDVYYNPAVWGGEAIDAASFIKGLPSAERDALLQVINVTTAKRGIALPDAAIPDGILKGARRVGLIQAATVRSSASPMGGQTYLFPPLNVLEDGTRGVTEALHERKLVAAHFMYGHEKSIASRGRIANPVVLVNALLNRGSVGPASNISTDYHLLEAAGIVRVDPGPGRSRLHLVKEDIVRDALGWLRQIYDPDHSPGESLILTASPTSFITPEVDASSLAASGAGAEIATASILALREQVARNVRGERA